MKTYYDYGTVTTLNDGDYIPVAPATPGTYKKITWSSIKSLIYSIIYPIGFKYTQYAEEASNDADIAFPSAYSPASLFGGTWELIYNTEGIVFQTEGYDGAGRANGLMEDQMQGHKHYTTIEQSNNSGSGHYTTLERNFQHNINYNTSNPISDGTNGTPRTGTRTSHRNRLMRVYRRIA